MNYLSHGRNHLDQPYALAGTALPDWLRVLGRHRFDETARRLPVEVGGDDANALAEGVHRHYLDDEWFHRSPVFTEVLRIVRDHIRGVYPEPFGEPKPRYIRASFYGHVLPEMLLDAWIMEQQPDAIDCYYASLEQVDASVVVAFVDHRLGQAPDRLAELVDGFRRYAFLRTYVDDREVCYRLGQVTRRVGLPPLPDDFERVVAWTRDLVREAGEALLTPPDGAFGDGVD